MIIIKMVIILNKKIIYAVIMVVIIGFLTGLYIYVNSNNDINEKNYVNNNKIVYDEVINNDIKKVDKIEQKILPSTQIIFEEYFTDCKHLITREEKDIEKVVNLTKEELEEIYNNWSVQEFSEERVVLYKESTGFCDEHYIIKNEEGYLTIYQLDENDNELLYNITDISTNYLPEEDLQQFKDGVILETKETLISFLEDFE